MIDYLKWVLTARIHKLNQLKKSITFKQTLAANYTKTLSFIIYKQSATNV